MKQSTNDIYTSRIDSLISLGVSVDVAHLIVLGKRGCFVR